MCLPPFSMPLTAAWLTVLSTVLTVSLAESTTDFRVKGEVVNARRDVRMAVCRGRVR